MATIQELTSRAEALGDKVNGHPEHNAEVLPELLAMLDQSQPVDVLAADQHRVRDHITADR